MGVEINNKWAKGTFRGDRNVPKLYHSDGTQLYKSIKIIELYMMTSQFYGE